MSRLGMLLLVAALTGCVTFTWQSDTRFEMPRPRNVATLEAGHTDLDACLERFGAPVWVWECRGPRQATCALVWAWARSDSHRVRVSVPVIKEVHSNFDYGRLDGHMRGLVLFFDPDWTLVQWRRGLLRDITEDILPRVRPVPVMEEEGGDQAPPPAEASQADAAPTTAAGPPPGAASQAPAGPERLPRARPPRRALRVQPGPSAGASASVAGADPGAWRVSSRAGAEARSRTC